MAKRNKIHMMTPVQLDRDGEVWFCESCGELRMVVFDPWARLTLVRGKHGSDVLHAASTNIRLTLKEG